jgi:hypothetical protein
VRKRILRTLGLTKESDALQMALSGEYISRTRLSHRGLGLPGLVETMDKGEIERLVLVANRAVGDVQRGTYVDLQRAPFTGTLVYWEISQTCKGIQWDTSP